MKNKKLVKFFCALSLIAAMPVAVSAISGVEEEYCDNCPSIAAATGRGFVADEDFAWLLPEQELAHTGSYLTSCCHDHHTYN